MKCKTLPLTLTVCICSAAISGLSGCSANFDPGPIAYVDKVSIGEITGAVHGGQAPVSGAQIYLFAAGTSGYGGASTSLIASGKTGVTCNSSGTLKGDCYVLTDTNGNFTLSGDYACTQGQQVYMVAVGGNPGLSGTVNNTAIVQMVALGQCPAAGNLASQVPYLVINEVTTVAFAYAMAPFATDAYHIGTTGTAAAQMAIGNAMVNANNLVAISYGGANPTHPSNPNSIMPTDKIYALADVLATCVNTSNSGSGTAACNALFNAAKNSSGVAPSDEATAIFNLAKNPASNVSNWFNLIPNSPVFAQGLSAAPADWTLPIIYKNVVSKPGNIAFDANGNAWISDSGKKAVLELRASGALSTYTNGGSFGAISNVAVNPVTGAIWAADSTNNQIYVLDSTGSVLTQITTGSLNKPSAIAFDRSGNGYVANAGAYVIGEYNSGGALSQTASYPSAQGYTSGIAVDYSGNVYTAGGPGNTGVGVLMAGSTSGQYYNNGSSGGSSFIALDATSNTPIVQAQYWTAANNVWTMTTSGVGERYYLFSTGYTFGGIVQGTYMGWMGGVQPTTAPSSIALDGAGNAWIANGTPVTVSWGPTYPVTGLTVSASYGVTAMAANGFSAGTASGVGAYTAAPDLSGNVWIANTDGSVTELIGLSTPVVTPTVPGKFATKP